MKNSFTLSFLLVSLISVKATHNRSGEILYKRVAPFTNDVGSATVQVYTYFITVIKYTDQGSSVADRCADTIYFGDGQKGVAPRINGTTTPTCNCSSIPCGEIILSAMGYTVKKNIYTITHTYAGPGTYLIRSLDPNRTSGIHNIPNSGNLPFYIESVMYVNASFNNNSSPVLSNPPIDNGILGSCLEINCCAFDADGDSLSYELSACKDANGQTISGYFYPETGSNGSININASSGLLTWCTPQYVDDYSVAIIVKEWRKSSCSGNYELLGYVLRDFQIIVQSATPASFSTSAMSDLCVKAGNVVTQTININSTYVVSKVLGVTASYTTSVAVINPTALSGNGIVTFSWQPNCSQARKQAYDVYLVFKVPGFSFDQLFYRQFKVTVIPPSPVILSTIVDTGKVTLNWTNCMNNVAGYNIYRKTGTNNWTPGACEQGVSTTSGYVLVGTAPLAATSFTDTNVWPILNGTAAQYVVTAFTQDCAESRADNSQSVTLIVGVNENAVVGDVKFYPNPVSSEFKIDLGKGSVSKSECMIVDVTGKTVFVQEDRNVAAELKFDLSTLSPGIYFVRMNIDGASTYTKIVKE